MPWFYPLHPPWQIFTRRPGDDAGGLIIIRETTQRADGGSL
jgi:hypothetical protein